MTNINTACVKNNASYQLNNALPNFEVHSDGVDVDNELFHYHIKNACNPYNIHTYKTEEVVNQRNIKIKNMTLDEINNTYCNNDYYNEAIREEPIDFLDRTFSSSSWPF